MIGCWNSITNYKKRAIQEHLGYYTIVRIFLLNHKSSRFSEFILVKILQILNCSSSLFAQHLLKDKQFLVTIILNMHKKLKDRFYKKFKNQIICRTTEAKNKDKKTKCKNQKAFISLLKAQSTTNLMVQIKSQMD